MGEQKSWRIGDVKITRVLEQVAPLLGHAGAPTLGYARLKQAATPAGGASVGDAEYVSEIDVEQRTVTLRMVRGTRKTPPPPNYIPRFGGYKVCAEAGRVLHVVRGPVR